MNRLVSFGERKKYYNVRRRYNIRMVIRLQDINQ